MSEKEFKISIIGGYGGMGKLFAKLFKDEGFEVTITGPNEIEGRKTAERLDVKYERNNAVAAGNSDITIISVPIEMTGGVIKEVAPAMKENSLLMDFTSIKEMPCRAMEKFAGKNVEIIGTHPIFGPRTISLDGQVFVVAPIRSKKWLQWLREFLKKHNARVFETTPEEHDSVMAVVQGLTHFAYISIGKTLQELDFDIRKSRNFSSPIYELMLDMVGRILGQDPGLYSSIQMENPQAWRVHKVFLKSANELSGAISKKDREKFIEIMTSAAKHFDDVDRAMGRSDKAISSLISELAYLKNSIGKELCLKHIYSGNVHLGAVISVTPDTVTIKDSGRAFELKLSNIQILSDEERIKYKSEKFGKIARDFSIIFNEDVDEKFISELLKRNSEDILNVSIKDIYRGDKLGTGKKSVCVGVEIINSNVQNVEGKIGEFFTRIGGKFR